MKLPSGLPTLVAVALLWAGGDPASKLHSGLSSPLMAAAKQSEPIFLAIPVVEGTELSIIPAMIFDGTTWGSSWPIEASESDLVVPKDLQSIPGDWLPKGLRIPEEWRIELSSGAALRFRVVRPQAGAHMLWSVALLTDAVLTGGESMRKAIEDEFAVSGSAVTGRFVSASPKQVAQVMAELGGRLAQLERRTLADWRAERKKNNPQLPAFELVPELPGGRFREASVITAVRPFRGEVFSFLSADKVFNTKPADPEQLGCGFNLGFEGVVVRNQRGDFLRDGIEASAFGNYCGDRGLWIEPVATVEWQGKLAWLARLMMEDGFEYTMYDPLTGKSSPPIWARVRPST